MNRLKILIWHIHGSYLNSLARVDHDWYLPIKPGRPEGYGGRGPTFDLPDNMHEIPAEQVCDLSYDVVVLQTPRNLHEDLPALLGSLQPDQALLYLEHNTPRTDPVNTRHPFADHDGLLVHVTAFNRLMWDNGDLPTRVIEHSVAIAPSVTYDGSLERGITVTNEMQGRPRITGLDIFERARAQVRLDVVGMKTEEIGGLGDVPYRELHRLTARYRFLFSPMRYTSMPLAVVEAMTIGMPVVALGTTALPDVIEHGTNGYVAQDPDLLIPHMQRLIADPDLAREIGARARETARIRFGMERFQTDWDAALREAITLKQGSQQLAGVSS
jgi:glycosyltransferase involved in cell wall biosynthesis